MNTKYNRRSFLKTAGICSAGLALTGTHNLLQGMNGPNVSTQNPFAEPGKDRPNILFLFTDDQTFNSVGVLNNPDVKTPNIDKLVWRGTTFTHCFNQGAWGGAVSVASRAMLNTGRYLWTCGGGDCGDYPLWGETLGDAGYDTFMTGKWHNKDKSLKQSFKTIGPYGGGMFPSIDSFAEDNKKKGLLNDPYNRPRPGNSWNPTDKTLTGHWRDVDGKITHSSKLWADAAIDYMQNDVTNSNNPFFMYVAFHAPHDPRQSPKEFVDMYPPEKIKIPPNYLPEHPFDQGDHKLRDEMLAPFPRSKKDVQVHISEYYAIITHADHQIGRILDALEKTGKADNTIIIFSADHGLAVGQHGLMGKQNQYDHSVRMPLIYSGPGIAANQKNDKLVYLQSAFATTCEMAQIAPPDSLQFPSILPLLNDKNKKLYDSVYGAYKNYQRMVRTDKYKLIRYPQVNEVQLFDLKNDPLEINDLAEELHNATVIKNLDKKLAWWMKETGDTLELNNPSAKN